MTAPGSGRIVGEKCLTKSRVSSPPMGTHVLQFLTSVTTPPLSFPPLLLINHPNSSKNPPTRCRYSARYGGRGGGSRWDSNAEETVGRERFRLNLEDEFLTDDEEDEDEPFGFKSAMKQRTWWFDDSLDFEDDDDDVDDFGFLDWSIAIAWISKVFRACGWMLPAIITSMLLGTGPDAFFMTLALPLAQSAISLAIHTLLGRSSDSPRPKRKPRTKRKPFARAASNIGMSKEKEQNTQANKGRGNYQSWAAANDVSFRKHDRSTRSFGGWDELDEQGRTYKVPKTAPAQKANEQRQKKKGRRVRNSDTPSLLRLLIGIFPFLGSWTKLL